ncbi:MAG: hypothetical protein AAF389_09970 [Gemmatimonadota bacterium]
MNDERRDPMIEQIRAAYHAPGETPKEEMWRAVEAKLGETENGVVDLAAQRELRRRESGWAARGMGLAVAAAAVLVLGVGIGRMTAPGGGEMAMIEPADVIPSSNGVALAAEQHFGRTESLLTMARADARTGRIDPMTAQWARELLAETRILLDAQPAGTSALGELLLDLELVLIQVVGAAETGATDETLDRTELELALRSLEEGEVLPRLQAALPGILAGA